MRKLALFNKSFWIIIAAIIFQQVVVASSSVWLTEFAQELKAGNFMWVLLLTYLFSLLLPYVPGAIGNHFLTVWSFESVTHFYKKTVEVFKGKAGLWNHEETRRKNEALLIKEGPQYVQDLTLYAFDVFSISLNALLNILVVIWLLDSVFLAGYVGGLFLTFILLKKQNAHHEEQAEQMEVQKSILTQHLSSAWDHWVLNNKTFLDSWVHQFETKKQKCHFQISELSRYKEHSSILLSLASFLPTLAATIHFAWTHLGNTEALLGLTVLLPRMFMILGNTTSLVYLIRDYSIMRSRGHYLGSLLSEEWKPQWENRIKMNQICIENNEGNALEIDSKIPETGYWTVRGPNGAGKSSWLLRLKDQLQEQACYLPPRSSLGVGEISPELSTGQRIKQQIALTLQQSGVRFLLLDEWDANLDDINRTEILKNLQVVSKDICVIDIRHR